MSALEAKEYGVVDEVFAQRAPLPGRQASKTC